MFMVAQGARVSCWGKVRGITVSELRPFYKDKAGCWGSP
jgi:hypothetical protein